MGKAFAHRQKKYDDALGDFYPTPKGLTIELLKAGVLDGCKTILEPACGSGAISVVLKKAGLEVTGKDIIFGNDFLTEDYSGQHFDAIVTNPPFALWDDFVEKAKKIDCKKIIFIGRMNLFGALRNQEGIWNELSEVYVFNRQVAYNRPFREDGKFECGCLVTGWFVWEKGYKDFPRLKVLDVNNWAYRKGRKRKQEVKA